jgi:rubrerythrin
MTRYVELDIEERGIRFYEEVKDIQEDFKVLVDQKIQQEEYCHEDWLRDVINYADQEVISIETKKNLIV